MPEPNPARPDRTWLYLGLGFVALWAAYLAYFNPLRPAGAPPQLGAATSGEPADYSWRVEDLDGATGDLSRFRGRPIFLNVWATWCGPCVREMPSIARLAANPKLKDVAFVCVSVDDSAGAVRRFLKGKDWPMTVLHAADPPPAVFATEGIPATFLIAPDGRIAAAEVGSSDWDNPSVVALLEGLGKPGAARH